MADRSGYIGRAPADSAVTVARQTFSPTGVTTDFTFASGYVSGYFDIYLNGVKMIEGSDYTSTDGSTFSILNGGAENGDVIEAVAYKAFNAATIDTAPGNLSVGGNLTVTGSASFGSVAAGTSVSFATTAYALEGTPDISVRNVTGVAATFTGVVTLEDVTNVDSLGIVTARSGIQVGASGVGGTITSVGNAEFVGLVTAKSGLRVPGGTATSNRVELGNSQEFTIEYNTSSTKGIISAASNPIDIQATTIKLLPNVGENGVIVNQNGSVDLYHDNALKLSTASIGATVIGSLLVGAGQSFGSTDGATAVYYGDGSNLTGISVGLSTEAFTSSGIVTAVRLSTAQDHKITATGFTTITSSGSGTEGESHTIRIVNSGIATVGFSTYFLFPSGAAPSLPTADGAISLISFTVHDSVGAGCTQLLAGASVNFS